MSSGPESSARQVPFRLDGRVALITGGGSERGIGRAIGSLFAAAGACVGLVDLDAAGVNGEIMDVNGGAYFD
jgi:NAD(P)-dependent dehydrogenase (short-subunit alcohol dehydrogenase family)